MSKGTKIFLIIILIIAVISALAIFLMRKQAPNTADQSLNQTTQNTLPASQPAAGNQNNQANPNSSQSAVNTVPSGSTAPASPSGKETASSEILNKYGKYAFETFQKYPALTDQLKTLDPNFNSSQMDPSYPSRTYRLSDGKDYLALGGCTERNCGGTKIIVLYNIADNKVYLGKENSAQTQLQFFGNPSDEEKNTMTNFYLQK